MKKSRVVLFFLGLALAFSSPSFSQSQYPPDDYWYFPEAIWANAAYGGQWASEVWVHDIEGGTQIRAAFYYGTGTGDFRGGWVICDNTTKGPCVYKSVNILKTIQDHFDTGFTYLGKVGFLSIYNTQGKPMHVSYRNYHSNDFGKTMNAYPAIQISDVSARPSFPIKILNIMRGSDWRTTCVFFNVGSACTAEFKIIGKRYLETCGFIIIGPPVAVEEQQQGATFQETFNFAQFKSFDPFVKAGCATIGYCAVPPFSGWRTYRYDCNLDVTITSGSGNVMAFGAVADNTTNDPAAIVPVRKN